MCGVVKTPEYFFGGSSMKKGLRKKWFCLALVLVLCILSCIPAYATEGLSDDPVDPTRYIGTIAASAQISIDSSGNATCTCTYTLRPGYTSEVSMRLQQKQSSWLSIVFWTKPTTGTSPFSGTTSVTSGYYYRCSVIMRVYDSNGAYVETVRVYSSKTYY